MTCSAICRPKCSIVWQQVSEDRSKGHYQLDRQLSKRVVMIVGGRGGGGEGGGWRLRGGEGRGQVSGDGVVGDRGGIPTISKLLVIQTVE